MRGLTIIGQILINAGADPNARDRLELTPLLVACGKPTTGCKNTVELLVQTVANVNLRDPLGNTPLLLSIRAGTLDIAALLVERVDDVLASSHDGETAITLACTRGDQRLVRVIEFKIDERLNPKADKPSTWSSSHAQVSMIRPATLPTRFAGGWGRARNN